MIDYTKYVTNQYKDSPKFIQLLELVTDTFRANTELLANTPNLYSVDLAVGSQLDTVGLWVGISRYISPAIDNVFFSWDTLNLGWEEGIWQTPYDDGGVTRLDDETYRILIKTKIVLNHFNGSIDTVITEMGKVIVDNILVIEDNMDMSYEFGVIGSIDALMKELLIRGYFDIRPSGVKVNYIKPSVLDTPFFGWDLNTDGVKGWDSSSWSIALT